MTLLHSFHSQVVDGEQSGTATALTRNPVLMLPCGFSRAGLPLGIQVIGRPFGDSTVLRAGHAYQTATDWHKRRPELVPGKPQPVVMSSVNEPVVADLDAATRSHVETMARRAGLELNERQWAILLETAPFAIAMAERMRNDVSLENEQVCAIN